MMAQSFMIPELVLVVNMFQSEVFYAARQKCLLV